MLHIDKYCLYTNMQHQDIVYYLKGLAYKCNTTVHTVTYPDP